MLLDPSMPPHVAPAEVDSAAAPVRRSRHRATARLYVYGTDARRRRAVEKFIREVYARRFAARLQNFAPFLVALESEGDILAAAGYRPATHPLFLERYLAAPIDAVLRTLTPDAPARARIAEVGHLAAVRPGAGRLLMPLLGAHLASLGFEWVASTATVELRSLFARMGLEPLVLGEADPLVLGADIAQWGSYYAHRPLVVAGSIEAGMARIARKDVPGPASERA
jgi:hypothetical protein